MFKKILCAVDGSDHALKAAELAADLASRYGAKLTILTVCKELKMTAAVKRYMQVEHLSGEPQYVLDEYSERVMHEAADKARKAGVKGVKSEVKTGHPARTIAHYAERNGYDAILLGSRGIGDAEGFLLGSVSHKVANIAKCTVITVK